MPGHLRRAAVGLAATAMLAASLIAGPPAEAATAHCLPYGGNLITMKAAHVEVEVNIQAQIDNDSSRSTSFDFDLSAIRTTNGDTYRNKVGVLYFQFYNSSHPWQWSHSFHYTARPRYGTLTVAFDTKDEASPKYAHKVVRGVLNIQGHNFTTPFYEVCHTT